jgi:hypothetical protein
VATAFATFGFTKTPSSQTHRDDGSESIVYCFDSAGPDGLVAGTIYHDMTKGADALGKADHEKQLVDQLTPDQKKLFYKAVTNYLRCYAASRDELVSEIRSMPRRVIVTKGESTASISEFASEETKAQVAKLL